MSAFDQDDDAMAEDENVVSLDQLDTVPGDDSIDLEGSDLADFNFGGEDEMPFSDEDEPE